MAHILFLGIDYESGDYDWSIVSTGSMEEIYNYLTPDSLIFVASGLLKDDVIRKQLLLIKLALPYVELFNVREKTDSADIAYFKTVSREEIPEMIKENTTRVYSLTDKRSFIKEITGLMLE
jgi:hypothetical protein